MITQEQIRQNIANAIMESDMTQREIAEKIGVRHNQITYYKQGKKMPALDTLANLCKVLDLDANEILGIRNF